MTTVLAARDAMMDLVRDAWLASATTSSIPLVYDDVKNDIPTQIDATTGRAKTYARISVRHIGGGSETLGGTGIGKVVREGILTVQIFSAFGFGHSSTDPMVEVVLKALERTRFTGGWFYDVQPREIGQDGPYFNTNVLGSFRYSDTR